MSATVTAGSTSTASSTRRNRPDSVSIVSASNMSVANANDALTPFGVRLPSPLLAKRSSTVSRRSSAEMSGPVSTPRTTRPSSSRCGVRPSRNSSITWKSGECAFSRVRSSDSTSCANGVSACRNASVSARHTSVSSWSNVMPGDTRVRRVNVLTNSPAGLCPVTGVPIATSSTSARRARSTTSAAWTAANTVQPRASDCATTARCTAAGISKSTRSLVRARRAGRGRSDGSDRMSGRPASSPDQNSSCAAVRNNWAPTAELSVWMSATRESGDASTNSSTSSRNR